MPQGNPRPGEFYRHFKNKQYQIVAVAEHSETGEQLVVYQALYGSFKTYVRPYEMFISEVDHVKYPDVEQKYRFEYLEHPEEMPVKEEIGTQMPLTDAAAESITETPKPACADAPVPEEQEALEAADPNLIRFMDADSFSDKFEVFTQLRTVMTDKLIDELAVVCDLVIPEGNLNDRYEQMKRCLQTRMKYERERNWNR